jgi:3-hydroxyacyl-CoA dehydrogenase
VTRVAILGAGANGAQICCEYALGGCSVVLIDGAVDVEQARQRVEESLRTASQYGLAGPADLERARALIDHGESEDWSRERLALIVEALPEQLDTKVRAIGDLAGRHPESLVASTSSTVSISAIGDGADVAGRMLATRYGDPPLLSVLVEILPARDTPPRLVERVSQLLRAIGKRPVVLAQEVPGLASTRLELALLRECVDLVERGVASAETIDELVRDGLVRSWRALGPLAAAATLDADELRGRVEAVAPTLTSALSAAALEQIARARNAQAPDARERRAASLAAELRDERARDLGLREDG